MIEKIADKIFAFAREGGFELRLVGGVVRDQLAGKPLGDIDAATPALPETVMNAARAQGLHVIPTGIKHGTVTVMFGNASVEITTLRADVSTDGRHAEVAFTDDWQADAARRDLTINALYMDQNGAVYDYHDGQADLKAGRVRFIGDATTRIQEDYLRILRFFRFHARFGKGEFNAEALTACAAHASGLKALSAERVRDEFLKLLLCDSAPYVLPILFENCMPPQMKFMPQMIAFERLLWCERTRNDDDALRRLMVLAGKLDSAGISKQVAALRLSNIERSRWLSLMKATREPDWKVAAYRHGKGAARDGMYWQAAYTNGELDFIEFTETLSALEAWDIPEFPLSGHDVAQALGVSGADLGEALRRAEEWWIVGAMKADKAQCLAYLSS